MHLRTWTDPLQIPMNSRGLRWRPLPKHTFLLEEVSLSQLPHCLPLSWSAPRIPSWPSHPQLGSNLSIINQGTAGFARIEGDCLPKHHRARLTWISRRPWMLAGQGCGSGKTGGCGTGLMPWKGFVQGFHCYFPFIWETSLYSWGSKLFWSAWFFLYM